LPLFTEVLEIDFSHEAAQQTASANGSIDAPDSFAGRWALATRKMLKPSQSAPACCSWDEQQE
jgi:hypothetical protein